MNTVPPPPVTAHPPPMAPLPPETSKEEPWGAEDPLLWSARRARFHTVWGSVAIAFLVLLFGAGMYTLFTVAIYEGDIEGHSSLILLFLGFSSFLPLEDRTQWRRLKGSKRPQDQGRLRSDRVAMVFSLPSRRGFARFRSDAGGRGSCYPVSSFYDQTVKVMSCSSP